MVFSSPIFLFCFLPLVILLYYIWPKVTGNYVLLIASLLFYAWGEPFYILVMLASIVLNYILGLLMTTKNKKLVLFFTILFNIGMLIIFKYSGFFVENVNLLFSAPLLPIPSIIMPIGISFFTFQAMSYVIDVYRGTVKANRNIFDIALYISFFPQLIAGPIVRYHDISEQIRHRQHSVQLFSAGVTRFAVGFVKKTLGKVCDTIFLLSMQELPANVAWVGAIAYMLQIYFDFSAYSDMAIGLAKMFGFELLENFNYPYSSLSIRDFWRRWHISLSTWFRDYLYIPLGGNRKGKVRTIINQWIVMLLCGLWHGASWTFITWGAYHATFQMLEKTKFGFGLKKLWKPIRWLYAMFIVIIGWVIFRAETLQQAGSYLLAMFGANGASNFMYPVSCIRFFVISPPKGSS